MPGTKTGDTPHDNRSRPLRTLGMAMALGLALASSGCASKLSKFTNSLNDVGPASRTGQSAPLDDLARRYDAKPGEKRASIAYADALRASGQHGQAVAVLERTSIQNVGDRDVAAAYGKALADIGRFKEAMEVLSQAHTADRPDWRVLSSQGAISDQMGEHPRAREFYDQALQIAPNEPAILSNLGLSYLLTKELTKAEETLRRAVALPNVSERTRANLTLVMEMKGKLAAAPATAPAKARPKVTPTAARKSTQGSPLGLRE